MAAARATTAKKKNAKGDGKGKPVIGVPPKMTSTPIDNGSKLTVGNPDLASQTAAPAAATKEELAAYRLNVLAEVEAERLEAKGKGK